MMMAPLQEGGNPLVSKLLSGFLEGTGERFKHNVLEFGSVCDPVQKVCNGICQAH